MRCYIVVSKNYGDVCTRIIQWCKFHDIDPVVTHEKIIYECPPEEECLVFSGNAYPSKHLITKIVNRDYFCTDVSLKFMDPQGNRILWFEPNSCIEGSYIAYFKGNMLRTPSALKKCNEVLDIGIEAGDADIHNTEIGNRDYTTEEKFDMVKKLIVSFWYNASHESVSCYYSHLFLLMYQKASMSIRSGNNEPNKYDNLYNWVLSQCFFQKKGPRTTIPGDLTKVETMITNMKLPLGNPIEFYKIAIEETKEEMGTHALTIPGICALKYKKTTPEWDMTKTIVSYYYDLGYHNKPPEVYLKSLEKLCSLKHPLIFFGDKSSCDWVFQHRNKLYTKIVCRDVKEFDLIKNNLQAFEDNDTSEGMCKSKRYALLTNLKPILLKEAAIMNPFLSSNFVFMDAGIFKHKTITAKIIQGSPCMTPIKTKPGKLTMFVMSDQPCSTDEDCIKGKETTLCWLIAADKTTCKMFCNPYETFVNTMISRGVYRTEQVYFTRLATLRPELFHFVEGSYNVDLELVDWE